MLKQGNNIDRPDKIFDHLTRRIRRHKKKRGRKMKKCKRSNFVAWYNTRDRKCYYCGIPEKLITFLEWHHKTVRRLTVDRKNSSRGYTLDNIVLCCERCNLIKNDFLSAKEMKEIARKYLKPKWKQIWRKQQKHQNQK